MSRTVAETRDAVLVAPDPAEQELETYRDTNLISAIGKQIFRLLASAFDPS